MKKLIILLLLILGYYSGFAQDIPAKPATYSLVHDYTGTLSAQQRDQLEQKLRVFEDSTSNQILVVLVKTTGDYVIDDYALKLGREWGVGQKDKNNGIILLVALGDRKVTIQVGYGLEGALPDIYTKRIRENDINPNFRAGNYYAGLDAGTDSIISAIKGEYKNDKPKAKNEVNKGGAGLIVIIIIIIIIALIKRGGGGNQVIGGRGVAEALFWSMLFSGGGRNSGGGFGGGSGGGGFGGGSFGGGSFGGGGSSGSW